MRHRGDGRRPTSADHTGTADLDRAAHDVDDAHDRAADVAHVTSDHDDATHHDTARVDDGAAGHDDVRSADDCGASD